MATTTNKRKTNNRELIDWMLEHKGVKITKTGWVSMIHQYCDFHCDEIL